MKQFLIILFTCCLPCLISLGANAQANDPCDQLVSSSPTISALLSAVPVKSGSTVTGYQVQLTAYWHESEEPNSKKSETDVKPFANKKNVNEDIFRNEISALLRKLITTPSERTSVELYLSKNPQIIKWFYKCFNETVNPPAVKPATEGNDPDHQ